MVVLVVFHHVRDYGTWKPVFDEHQDVRRAHGATEHRVYRSPDVPDRVIVHVDFPDEASARGFMADPSLPPAMERAGVTDEPWLGLVEPIERREYGPGEPGAIAVVHHRVRDYGVWKPVFDEHEDVRRAHGQIEHRLYHAFGDPLTLVIHNDFPSLEDAHGFAADPSLPEAMARGGVEGEPGVAFLTRAERKVYAEG